MLNCTLYASAGRTCCKTCAPGNLTLPRRQPVALLDLRLSLMPAVAAYKRVHDLPIEDRTREQALLKRLTDQAQLRGLSATAIKSFFRIQIDLAKQVQQESLTPPAHIPDWARGLDLH